MKFLHSILSLALLTVSYCVMAQTRETYGGAVDIVELYEGRAVFCSVGTADEKGDVLVAAEKNLFQKLLYDGVEGFNDDKPLAERKSTILDSFFQGKYQKELMGIKTGTKDAQGSLPYRAYVVSSYIEEPPTRNEEGRYAATALIVVNCSSLTRYLETNKVILRGDSTVVIKENVKAARPNFLGGKRDKQ